MEQLEIWFMAAVVGLLLGVRSDVNKVRKQLEVEENRRKDVFQEAFKRWRGEGAKVTQPLPKVAEGVADGGRVARVSPRVPPEDLS